MPDPERVFVIEGEDWMKGISLHPTLPLGGLFRTASNFDPFQKFGVHVAMPAVRTVASTGATAINWETNFVVKTVNGSDNGRVRWFGFTTAAVAFDMTPTNFAVTDRHTALASRGSVDGAGYFLGRVLIADKNPNPNEITSYQQDDLSSETVIVNDGYVSTATVVFHVAPDRNCYFTNRNYVGRITSISGTTGNSAQYLTIGAGSNIKTVSLESDSQHLVVIGNTDRAADYNMTCQCFVAFWNMRSFDLTRWWTFEDIGVTAIKRLGNSDEFIVFGVLNAYLCSIGQYPRVIFPLDPRTGFAVDIPGRNYTPVPGPTSQYQVDTWNGCVVWTTIDATTGKNEIWGYGSPIVGLGKVLFKMSDGSNENGGVTLAVTSERIFSSHGQADAGNGVEEFLTGTAAQAATVTVAGIVLPKPYRFAFARIVLNKDLATGDEVTLQIKNDNQTAGYILPRTTRSFTVDGARSILKYQPGADAVTRPVFDQIDALSIVNKGAEIKRVEIWATPQDPKQAMN